MEDKEKMETLIRALHEAHVSADNWKNLYLYFKEKAENLAVELESVKSRLVEGSNDD